MALTLTISKKELERQAGLTLEGKDITVFLALNPGALTSESSYADWYDEVVTGSGYADVTEELGVGSYNNTTARWELPAVTATFTCTSATYSYNTVCVRIGEEDYLHSINVESPGITLVSGQSKTYTITLAIDN